MHQFVVLFDIGSLVVVVVAVVVAVAVAVAVGLVVVAEGSYFYIVFYLSPPCTPTPFQSSATQHARP